MGEREIICRGCGKRLFTYSKASFRRYKSPVKNCKKCGTRYADLRCHEIAIEGIPDDTFKISSYIVLLVFGALVLYRGIYLFGYHQLGMPDYAQWLMPAAFVLIGVILIFGGLFEIFTILSGIKAKRFKRLEAESISRMNDKNYVTILQELGYSIPEEYL